MKEHLPALVTLLAVLLMFGTAFAVGLARGRYGIQAPATSGHPAFERAFRVQMNTLEATLLFLPTLWVAASYGYASWAGIAGLVWLAGRTWYALAYLREAARRGGGFLVGMVAWAATLLMALAGLGRTLFVG
ncbi:MAPEG family protein [Frateuria terrea]|uniref:MAPEG family protein n=1 Tax=Frateuria terrea TaxID=529704 RepID=A0A1H6XYB9_9GAMM|nr:MAPEG family protein [Frateuria terrea]SEJ34068.1 MAPEG family protein [Frateuria terrea]SFP50498.1 MAPEG family protein [Frateuria terrea]